MWNVAIAPGWIIFSVWQSRSSPFLHCQQGCEASEAAGQAPLCWVGTGTWVRVRGPQMGSASSFLVADLSLCNHYPKGGLFFFYTDPTHLVFCTPGWGQKLCSNKKWWWCALKSTHTKFIYFSLGWRLGCVFFVQTLFLNSEAKHSLAFVGFFLFPRTAFCMYWQENSIALKDLKVSSASAALKVQLH